MEGTFQSVRIAIIGAGGIGSNLSRQLAPALANNSVVQSLGGVEIAIYDSDVVESGNIHHQAFIASDIGESKVSAVCRALSAFQSPFLNFCGQERDIRSADELNGYDIVVVCVDSSPARIATHSKGGNWLDLRCRGDNYLALDHRVEPAFVESVTDPEQRPGSCQFDGALESGNIQFGHSGAVAHGCQWITQCLRLMAGEDGVMLPYPKSESITFGTLERFPLINGRDSNE